MGRSVASAVVIPGRRVLRPPGPGQWGQPFLSRGRPAERALDRQHLGTEFAHNYSGIGRCDEDRYIDHANPGQQQVRLLVGLGTGVHGCRIFLYVLKQALGYPHDLDHVALVQFGDFGGGHSKQLSQHLIGHVPERRP